MKRVLKALSAVALMVVLLAANVAPAFAVPPEEWGHTCGGWKNIKTDKEGVWHDGSCGFKEGQQK